MRHLFLIIVGLSVAISCAAHASFAVGEEEILEDFEGGIGAWTEGGNAVLSAEGVIKVGTQSLAIGYDDVGGNFSEAVMFLANRDLSNAGMQISYRGKEGNDAEDIYVKVNGSKVYTYNSASTLDSALSWRPFKILYVDLTTVAGIDNVTSIAIGVGDGTEDGNSGTLYIDDIIVHGPKCINIYPGDFYPDPFHNDVNCHADVNELDMLLIDWLRPSTTASSVMPADTDLLVYFDFEEIKDPTGAAYVESVAGSGSIGRVSGTIALAAGPAGHGNAMDTLGTGFVELENTNTVLGAILDDNDGATIAFWAKTNPPIDPTTGELALTDARYTSGGKMPYWKMKSNGQYSVKGLGGTFSGYAPAEASGVVGNWNHMAYVVEHSAGITTLYLNGEIVYETTRFPLIAELPLSNMTVGARKSTRLWPCMVDEYRIYSRALSQGEIMGLADVAGPITQVIYSIADTNKDGAVNLIDLADIADVWMTDVLWP